jgi:hydrogenase maturation protein HypF
MLQRRLNCPSSTSAGRWFDAAAAALGLCLKQTHEAEAAIALERQAAAWLAAHDVPPFEAWVRVDSGRIDLKPLFAHLFELGERGEPGRGAALFHAVLAEALAQAAHRAAADAGVHRVVLAGGCFCNRVLTGRLVAWLERFALDVLLPQAAGCGDAGLALGQAHVAALALPAGAALQEDIACA